MAGTVGHNYRFFIKPRSSGRASSNNNKNSSSLLCTFPCLGKRVSLSVSLPHTHGTRDLRWLMTVISLPPNDYLSLLCTRVAVGAGIQGELSSLRINNPAEGRKSLPACVWVDASKSRQSGMSSLFTLFTPKRSSSRRICHRIGIFILVSPHHGTWARVMVSSHETRSEGDFSTRNILF